MIACLLDQVVQTRAFRAQHQAAISIEVEVGVVRRSAFVEPNGPNVRFLHLLERTGHVGHTCDRHMFARSRAGLRDHRRDGRGPTLRQQHAIHPCAIRRAQQRPKVVRVFDAVERKKKSVMETPLRPEQILDRKELTFPHGRDRTLVRLGLRDPRKLLFPFYRHAHSGGAAELYQAVQPLRAIACDQHVLQPSPTCANRLLHRVKAVKNFHTSQFTA